MGFGFITMQDQRRKRENVLNNLYHSVRFSAGPGGTVSNEGGVLSARDKRGIDSTTRG